MRVFGSLHAAAWLLIAVANVPSTAWAERLAVSTIARAGLGDGHPAVEAPIGEPSDITVDADGNLYFVTYLRIRRVGRDGIITTIAGGENLRDADEARSAAEARFCGLGAIAAAPDGTVYFDDCGTVRAIAPDGSLQVVRRGIYDDGDLAVGPDGSLYVAEPSANRIWLRSPDGSSRVFRRMFAPELLAIATDGRVAVFSSGWGGGRPQEILVIDPDGTIRERHDAYWPSGLEFDAEGHLLATMSGDRVIRLDAEWTPVVGNNDRAYYGDGGPATEAALFWPDRLARGVEGDLFILDDGNSRIRRVTSDSIIHTVAGNGTWGRFGDGGPADGAGFACGDLEVGADGSIVFIDHLNSRIAQVAPDGVISTLVEHCGRPPYGDDEPRRPDRCLGQAGGIDLADDGGVFVADIADHVVRRVAPDGTATIVAGNGLEGDFGAFVDGAPATETALYQSDDVAVGADGAIYVSQNNSTVVGRIGTDGIIRAIIGRGGYGQPSDGQVALDAPLFYGTDLELIGDRLLVPAGAVWELLSDGTLGLVAGGDYPFAGDGGPATLAGFDFVHAFAMTPNGDLHVADGERIRRVRNGIITTVAGTGLQTATPSSVGTPVGLAAAPDGTLVVCDGANGRILRIDPGTTVAVCAGDCDDDGTVSVDELLRATGIALSGRVNDCESFGGTSDRLTVADLLRAVRAALTGCS
jgi:DNA-binding beta-propeller fold protein YncE